MGQKTSTERDSIRNCTSIKIHDDLYALYAGCGGRAHRSTRGHILISIILVKRGRATKINNRT